ncbi:MAG TPA: glycosyl hydrolase 53 family protein [Anaerolineales bacterium]|nr:glycosyl hydrolase 53 family protein [Anaerolineales bacterium]
MKIKSHPGHSKLVVILAVLSLLVGCATPVSQPTAEFTDTPMQAAPTAAAPTAAAPSAADQTVPPLEPGPMTPTPEIEPAEEKATTPEGSDPNADPINLFNPGFETQAPDGLPSGWSHTGAASAVRPDDRGHSGDFRLTHQGTEAYQVETSQQVMGLDNGWYTLRIWVRSSGGQNAVYAALKCGDAEKRVHIPSTSPGYRWLQLVVSNQVTDGQCTISLVSDGLPDTWASFDDLELSPGQAALSILGSDISSLTKSEDLGGIYKDSDGTAQDALQILKEHGMNYARLRVWVDPADGYHDKDELLEMALRLKSQGIKLLVDFHYSDNWADPGKQIKPAAWKDYDFEQLKQAVYDHTFDVCSSLVAQGTPPEMVQIGNEINSGMLWPDGDYEHFDNLAALLKEGYRAVKECSASTIVMLHIAEGGDNDLARWWFDNITRREVPFDVIGISYYAYWHGSLAELQYNLNDITARYDKDVIVVETAYTFTDQDDDDYPNIATTALAVPNYPLSPAGQRAMLRDIMSIVRAVPNGRGLGVFYWDAVWTAVPGNGWDGSDPTTGNAWENQALFDFEGQVLPALDEFLTP